MSTESLRPCPDFAPGGGRGVRRIALVATDVDGTLTRGGKLDPAVLAAIHG
jgi:hypothetical protein